MTNLYFIYNVDLNLPELNPFSQNGLYGDNWVTLKIVDTDKFQMMTGEAVIFNFTISKQCDGWQYRVMDYINYQCLYKRNIIVICTKEEYDEATSKYEGHSIYDTALRDYEPRVLVHSTTKEAFELIKKDGYLKSWNVLKSENNSNENKPIGTLLGDPADFSDYVMLGGGTAPEIVVSSKQKGFICMDIDVKYTAGARMYFDVSTLAENGLLMRDGAHYKVKNKLPLKMVSFCATLDNVDMQGLSITPKNFAEMADETFQNHVQQYI